MQLRWISAGLLSVATIVTAQETANSISTGDAWRHKNQEQTVCGQIVDTSYLVSVRDSPTYLYLDRPRPEQIFTVEIPFAKRQLFGDTPEKSFRGKHVCITGRIEADSMDGTVDRKHRAKIVVEDENQLTVG